MHMGKLMTTTVLAMLISTAFMVFLTGETEGGPTKVSIEVSRLYVNVTYPDETPASDIHVYLHRWEYFYYTGGLHEVTNSTGQAVFPVNYFNLGPCAVTIFNTSKIGYNMEKVYIHPGEEAYMDMVLTEHLPYNRTVTGTVYNRTTGSPVNGAIVNLRAFDLDKRQVDLSQNTGPDGTFSFDVPYSDRYYYLSVSHGVENFLYYENYFFTDPDSGEWVEDVYLTPETYDDTEVRLRFFDEYTLEPLGGEVEVSGYQSFRDHCIHDPWFGTPLGPDGWGNTSVGEGEYMFHYLWERDQPVGMKLEADLYEMVNYTDVERELPLSVPRNLRNITLEVVDADDGDTISSGYAYYQSYDIDGKMLTTRVGSYNLNANSTGIIKFQIPADMEFNVTVRAYSYEDSYMAIPEGAVGVNESYTVYLTEEEGTSGPEMPTGNISVRVVDSKNSHPLPSTYIRIAGGEDLPDYYGSTDNHGYYNETVAAGTYPEITGSLSLGDGLLYNVTVEENQRTEVTLIIIGREFPEVNKVNFSFRMLDPEGVPLTDQIVQVGLSSHYTTMTMTTDSRGFINIYEEPGKVSVMIDRFSSYPVYRSHYSVGDTVVLQVGEEGGFLGDITAYPTDPLTEVTGFVKDMETDEILPYTEVNTYSFVEVDDKNTRYSPFYESEENRIELYEQDGIGSNLNGFYRIWGRDNIRINCQRSGYFPYEEVISSPGRGIDHDILLEPLIDHTLWVNGTVVDQNGDPVNNTYVWLDDIDRNDHTANQTKVNQDGEFSFMTYPGDFRIEFTNFTLSGSEMITVSDNIEDLNLRLIPYSDVSGSVHDYNGTPLGDINVTLMRYGTENVTIDWINTSAEGTFEFKVTRGDYFLRIGVTDEFNPYTGEVFNLTGWNDHHEMITLENRSVADVFGTISGLMGGSISTIPDCSVHLIHGTDTLMETTTDIDGSYGFELVEYGTGYRVKAIPPESLMPNEEVNKPGLLENTSEEFEVTGFGVNVDLQLEYISYGEVLFYNITDYSPKGDNVSLSVPIVIAFSAMVNGSQIEDAVSITPEIEGADFILYPMDGGSVLYIYHDGLIPNTTYHVEVSWILMSAEGRVLWNYTGIEWEFTTGSEATAWNLSGPVDIDVGEDKTVNVKVLGNPGLSVVFYLVEDDFYYVMSEDLPGEYTLTIDGFALEWGTSYSFFFTDRYDGIDKAPDLAGTFQTPEEPGSDWWISSAEVYLDEDGNLQVQVEGNPGIDIYIVISGIGSFELDETSTGHYTAEIPSSNFMKGTEYYYYFSDSMDGEDMSPTYGGNFETEEEKEVDEPFLDGFCLWCLVALFAIIVIIVIIFLVATFARKRGEEDREWEE